MTGKELWEQYQRYTKDITEHGRKMGFAGAAICWIFKRNDFTFPFMIYVALFFFIAYFMADIFQGLSGALMTKFFTEGQEAKDWHENKTIESDYHKPRWVDRPAFFFFIVKCLLLLTGFGFIGLYLLTRLV